MHSYCVYNYQKLPSRTYWNPARSATSLQQIENTGWHISRHNSASFLMWINLNVDLQVVCTNHLKNVYWSAQSAPCSEQPANTLQTINIAFQRALETEGQLYRERGKKIRTCKVGGFSKGGGFSLVFVWCTEELRLTWGCVLVETICSTVVLQQCNRGLSLHLPGPPATSSELKYSRFLGTRWLKMTKQFRGKTITADGCVEFRKRTLDEWAWTFMAENRQPVT